jgi:hypothetical protein
MRYGFLFKSKLILHGGCVPGYFDLNVLLQLYVSFAFVWKPCASRHGT